MSAAYPQCPICRQQHAEHRACRREDLEPAQGTTVARRPATPTACRDCAGKDALIAELRHLIADLQRSTVTPVVSQPVSHAVSQPLAKPKRDRKEYQRELMRQRRGSPKSTQ